MDSMARPQGRRVCGMLVNRCRWAVLQSSLPTSAGTGWAIGAIFVLALALRFYKLTYHSLWFDEVMSTVWAARPPAEIWGTGLALVQDKHPPLYYLLLHVWGMVFGWSDVAVRSLGVLMGSLAVWPLYGIGAQLGGRVTGLIGALLLALNPFLVWYSQEARMFMPATTCLLVGLYGLLRLWSWKPRQAAEPSRCTIILALLAIAGFLAALYTYLFSALLLPVAGAWVVLLALSSRGKANLRWHLGASLGVLIMIGLLFAPLARSAWSVSGSESSPGRAFEGVLPALRRLMEVFTFGWAQWSHPVLVLATGFAAFLASCGVLMCGWLPWKRTRGAAVPRPESCANRTSGILLALWLLLPVLIGALLVARDRTVFAETRYFIFLVPALCLAWASATAWLWQRYRAAGIAVTLLFVGLTIAALPADWSPYNRREAWRESAALVAAEANSTDAVLIQADYVSMAFARYFHGSQPVFSPMAGPVVDADQVDKALTAFGDYDALWLVQAHHQELDPANQAVGWLAARYPLMTEAYPAGIAIHAYVQHYRLKALPVGVTPLQGAVSMPGMQLFGCRYQPPKTLAKDDLLHPPSSWVHVTTYWSAGGEPRTTDIWPTARLVDAMGQVWGASLDRANDALHFWPTSRWQPAEVVRVDYDINLNPVTPDGQYRVVIAIPGQAEQTVCGAVEVVK